MVQLPSSLIREENSIAVAVRRYSTYGGSRPYEARCSSTQESNADDYALGSSSRNNLS